jgi:C-lobe and N-lobe beta barrels of Tf-binding protein B
LSEQEKEMSGPIKTNVVSKVRLAALGVPFALVLAACGGGGSSTTASSGAGGSGSGSGNPAVQVTTETGTKLNFVGTCTSVQGGALGYELGLCYSGVNSTTFAAEALFQNRGVTVSQLAESPLKFSLAIPAEWSGPVTLTEGELAGTTPTTQKLNSQIADLTGVGIQKCLPDITACTVSSSTVALTSQTSALDLSYFLPGISTRYTSYGIWAHTPKVSSDYYYGGFSTTATGASKTSAAILSGAGFTGTGTLAFVGNGGAWIMSQQTTVGAGGNAASRVGADVSVQFDKATGVVTGTVSKVRRIQVTSGVTSFPAENIADLTFSATVNRADGSFEGAVSGSNKLRVKGALYGPNGDQMSGQFAGTASDNRVLTGAFGAKL